MKVGIIRCQQTETYCPATTCLLNAVKGEGGFAETVPVEVIGVNSFLFPLGGYYGSIIRSCYFL